MPSLHIAWAVWCSLALWRITKRRWLRVTAVIYPCLTAFAVLATGNHFVLDILAGLAAIGLAVLCVSLATRWRRRPSAALRSAWRTPREVGGRHSPDGDRAAYRMSQTCYEVPDQVD
jgi:membrane-associated phospholipid phosphatase